MASLYLLCFDRLGGDYFFKLQVRSASQITSLLLAEATLS